MATICRHFVAKAETATLIIFVGRPLQSEISASLRETFTTTWMAMPKECFSHAESQRRRGWAIGRSKGRFCKTQSTLLLSRSGADQLPEMWVQKGWKHPLHLRPACLPRPRFMIWFGEQKSI